MKYVTEFKRWRDAPAAEREQIARHQVEAFDIIAELAPDLDALRDNPADAIMWNGKYGRDCAPDEFKIMFEWFHQLLIAARAMAEATTFRASTGAFRI